jgi:hypothetical protein
MISNLQREVVGWLAVWECFLASLTVISLRVFIRVDLLFAFNAGIIEKCSSILGWNRHDHTVALVVPGALRLPIEEITVTHKVLVHFLEHDEG